MLRVKICGITSPDDAAAAIEAGADALGFVFYGASPRNVTAEQARRITAELPPFITTVGVFVDEAPGDVDRVMRYARLDCAQLHGDEAPEACIMDRKVIKAIRVSRGGDIERMKDYRAAAFLLDAYRPGAPGGTGEKFDWDIAVRAKDYGRIILAGGLTPGNVAEAVRVVRPYAVDVSSGVEAAPGRKDREKLVAFIRAAKGA